ncbi:MAG TPA: hypothetical protein VMG35_14695 [Bryobacteraceae bacterium]|nr:hypothetical protein [Bryobacteraceae bacterium]
MKLSFCLAAGLLILASGFQFGKAQDKTTTRTLKVKVNYTGSGTVDDKHKIQVFMFDSPDFAQGNGMPTGMQMTAAKDGTVTFTEIAGSPVYLAAVYDPSGGYDGESGPPPTGSSLGMYTKEPPKPEPINIDPGKTAEVELPFDDTAKMP